MHRSFFTIALPLLALALLLVAPGSSAADKGERKSKSKAAPPTWRLARSAKLRWDPFRKGRILGRLRRGTRVTPLAVYRSSRIQVKLADGRIGWIPFTVIREARRLVVNRSTRLLSRPRFRRRYYKGKLMRGSKVRLLRRSKRGYIKVRDERGRTGYMYTSRTTPEVLDKVPRRIRRRKYVFVLLSSFKSDVSGMTLEQLRKEFGAPWALDRTGRGKARVFYGRFVAVADGRRRRGLAVSLVEGKAIDVIPIGKARSAFVEKLPLAGLVRRIPLSRMLDGVVDTTAMAAFQRSLGKIHWTIKWAGRLLGFALGILLLAIPHFILAKVVNGIAYIRALPNGLVKAFSALLTGSVFYVYYLFWGLHLSPKSYVFFLFALGLIGLFSLNYSRAKINYHRCPNCNTMWGAEDRGSRMVNKTHVTESDTSWVKTGTTETAGTITHHYRPHTTYSHKTEKEFEDDRRCLVCGQLWAVKRKVTEGGHT